MWDSLPIRLNEMNLTEDPCVSSKNHQWSSIWELYNLSSRHIVVSEFGLPDELEMLIGVYHI